MAKFTCKHPGCKHVSRTQAQAVSHAWEHRRAAAKAALKKVAAQARVQNRTLPAAPPAHTYQPTEMDLRMMLAGYEREMESVTKRIQDLHHRLGTIQPSGKHRARGKHRISAEGRARIAAAQKRRWAALKAAQPA